MIGTLLGGKYMIESFVGSGGMAQVYRAHDVTNGKVVAVKVLKDEFKNDAEFVRRFEREARSGLALSHDNIVHLLDVGECGEANYIVFEYISGKTLKDYIKQNGAFSPRAAVNMASQVLSALSHAHERGIIHRDVKPQNVIITESGAAKLADFGIARDSAATTKTFTGSDVLGSVHYISPEQARGDEVTEKSDLYSVAIMLYEMLTGTVPFDSENSVSVALKHLSENIQPPIERNNKLPPSLNDVVLKAASKDPAMRYGSAVEMNRDLIRALNNPNGKFAKQEVPPQKNGGSAEPNNSVPGKSVPVNKGISRIIVVIGLLLSLFVFAFIIITANYNATYLHVPNLVGKTYDEALAAVGNDFSIEIVEYEVNPEYPPGQIIWQNPASSMRASVDSVIKVAVSMESESVLVPDLANMTVLEANDTLSKYGLVLSNVEYDPNSDAPEGKVFEQIPAHNAETERGAGVTIRISGEQTNTIQMANVKSKKLSDAVAVLKTLGFEHVLVRFVPTDDAELLDSVISQNIDPGPKIPRDIVIILEVYGETKGAYSADRSFTVSIPANDTTVLVTVATDYGYEKLIYSASMSAGTQVIPFTATTDKEGTFACILYLDGVMTRSEDAKFNHSNS